MKDDLNASRGDKAIPDNQRTTASLPNYPLTDLRQNAKRTSAHLRKGLIVPIALCLAVLLIAGSRLLFTQRSATNQAIGTLLYTYHTDNKESGQFTTYVNSVAWSPDGKYLACATGDQAVHILEPATQEEVFVYRGHHSWVNNVIWFPDSSLIASASGDHTIQIWDATTGKNTSVFVGTSSLWAVAISRDGHLIAGAGKDGSVQVWQVSPKATIYTYKGQVSVGGIWGLAFSPDGKRIASGDSTGAVHVWDTFSGDHVLIYHDQKKQIYDLKWSPDGQFIASASEDGTVMVWNASTGRTVYTYRSSISMQAVSWSPDRTTPRIASASADGTVQVWNAFDGGNLFVYRHHSGIVFTVAWSPDSSRIASGDESGSVQVWKAK